jgi:hypothetical protein
MVPKEEVYSKKLRSVFVYQIPKMPEEGEEEESSSSGMWTFTE